MEKKKMLLLKASEDVSAFEINNIVSQMNLYGINTKEFTVSTESELIAALSNGEKYNYLYLATHGCETEWGNLSNTLNVTWEIFSFLVCDSNATQPDAIFLHSCCRGGLDQVAYDMFASCGNIQYVCGPRQNLLPVDLITAFNLFLYYIEVKNIDPVVAAQKVLKATDLRLICFDRLETVCKLEYKQHEDELMKRWNEKAEDFNPQTTTHNWQTLPDAPTSPQHPHATP